MNPSRSKASSSSSEDENSGDIWDDTLIIKNYDESLTMVREQVAKRLAMQTNKKLLSKAGSQDQQQQQTQASTSDQVKQEAEGESSGVENSSAEKGACETGNKPSYKVADYCRATYDDGVDYEAKILAVDKSGDALIRYVGYNNEQTVSIEGLVPSWGRKARRKQREDAAELAAAEDTNRMDVSDEEHQLTDKASKIRINFDPNFRMSAKAGPSKAASSGFHAGMGASFTVPPPPPMPPMLEDDDDLESENLSAMLMSWYMSGYYTGLYHGQKMSQKRARSS